MFSIFRRWNSHPPPSKTREGVARELKVPHHRRIVVAFRLRLLGSANSLLWAVSASKKQFSTVFSCLPVGSTKEKQRAFCSLLFFLFGGTDIGIEPASHFRYASSSFSSFLFSVKKSVARGDTLNGYVYAPYASIFIRSPSAVSNLAPYQCSASPCVLIMHFTV